ncbi:hypothetical protein TcG_07819 [Trypanosoma cruzi]|nr:hypothetical protein TcG_07819 [Trypanosoma cruzi]
MGIRERLVAFYQKHNPAKLCEVDSLLEAFAGREETMFAALRVKYEESDVTDGVEATSRARKVNIEPGMSETESNTVCAEMQDLLRDMESVDLRRLLDQLSGRAIVEGDLLVHAMRFMQHFTTCAHRFQDLSGTILNRTATATQNTTAGAAVPLKRTAGESVATQTESISPGRCDAAVHAVRVETVSTGTQTDMDGERLRDVSFKDLNPTSNSHFLRAQMPPIECSSVRPNDEVRAAVAPAALKMDKQLYQHRSIGMVHKLKPDKHKRAAVIGALLTKGGLADTDSVTLEPGVYHENLCFLNSGNVELVAVFPGAPVIIRPLSNLEPIIRAAGRKTRLRLSGVVLVENDTLGKMHVDVSAPNCPLVAVADGAHVDFHGCRFYQGSCAVEAVGLQTDIRLHLSLISSCTFAGVFLRHGAKAVMTQCKVTLCEAGVRVASNSSMHARETVLEENTTDGIVGYEGAEGTLERSSVLRNGGNGIFLSPGSNFMVTESTVELNGLYGIQRLQSSVLRLRDSIVRDNGLLPINHTDEKVSF